MNKSRKKKMHPMDKLFIIIAAATLCIGIIGVIILMIITYQIQVDIDNMPEIKEVPNVYLEGFIPDAEEDIKTLKNEIISIQYGLDTMEYRGTEFVRMDTPDLYYDVDYDTMQPYMSYKMVTNQSSSSYQVCHSENAYTDENGYRRYKVAEGEYSVDGQDDYVIALGNYYKEKGVCGERFLIITSNGSYTAITGDEKADCDTDAHKMIHMHSNEKASVIEWIVDPANLESSVKKMGSVKYSENPVISGNIIYIYKIQ